MTNKPFFNTYGKHILIWVCISTAIGVALKFGIDKKVVVFGTVVIGVFTQAFAGLATLMAAVPLIVPVIVKGLSIPFCWLLNAMGYFVGAVAIKMGKRREFAKSRVLAIEVFVGIIIAYIIVHGVQKR